MLLDHRKFLAGDPLMVELFVQATRRWVRKFFKNPQQIDSVVQEALLEMTARLRAGEEPKPGYTLYWIEARANNAVRRELTRMRKAAAEAFESQLHGCADVDLSRVYRLRRELEDIEALLEDCKRRTREILEAKIRGLTYKEIARVHELSEGAARDSVSRLRKHLVDELTTRDKVEYLMRQARRFGLDRHRSKLPRDSTRS